MSKDMPSILKLVEAGQSTAANTGGLIPERPARTGPGRGAPGGRGVSGDPTPAQIGRTVYEQACQSCHGPELKGERGPAIDAVISRLGPESTRDVIVKGRGGMPAFSSVPEPSMNALIAFLTNPGAGAANSQTAALTAMARMMREPDYPADVDPPPSRYKTGYGNEGYVITPPWSSITAYDLNTGKIKWKMPYGDLPQAGPSDTMRGNVFPKSGMVITAGGLVLFAGNDSKLYALDKDTGKLIFSKELPNGSLGVPAVYEVNGREYVLFAVSGGNPYPAGAYMPPGGVMPPATSKGYIAFALPAPQPKH